MKTNKLEKLKESAKAALKNGFDNKDVWEFDPFYGTPFIRVEIHSLIHDIIKELSELTDEAIDM